MAARVSSPLPQKAAGSLLLGSFRYAGRGTAGLGKQPMV